MTSRIIKDTCNEGINVSQLRRNCAYFWAGVKNELMEKMNLGRNNYVSSSDFFRVQVVFHCFIGLQSISVNFLL